MNIPENVLEWMAYNIEKDVRENHFSNAVQKILILDMTLSDEEKDLYLQKVDLAAAASDNDEESFKARLEELTKETLPWFQSVGTAVFSNPL